MTDDHDDGLNRKERRRGVLPQRHNDTTTVFTTKARSHEGRRRWFEPQRAQGCGGRRRIIITRSRGVRGGRPRRRGDDHDDGLNRKERRRGFLLVNVPRSTGRPWPRFFFIFTCGGRMGCRRFGYFDLAGCRLSALRGRLRRRAGGPPHLFAAGTACVFYAAASFGTDGADSAVAIVA